MHKLAAFAVILTGVLAPAITRADSNLIDEVDKLTPEQAYLFNQKLQAKVLSPVPESFITHITVALSGGVGVYNPSNYNDYLAPTQAKVTTAGFWKADLMWKLCDHFLLGFQSSFNSVNQTKVPSANTFYSLSIFAPTTDVAAAYQIPLSDHFFLAPGIAIGGIFAWVTEETTNDTAKTTYDLRYWGSAFHLSASLPIYYRLNRIWSIGLTNSFQIGNITNLQRAEDHPANVPNLNLTGYQGSFTIAFNL